MALTRVAQSLRAFNSRIWIAVYLALVAALSLEPAWQLARSNAPYAIGDWLINYSGGFVRRGLPGEMILVFHRLSHLPFPWLAYAMQVLVFMLFLVGVYRLIASLRLDLWTAAVFLSPATLSFFPLNRTMGYRKEILLYAGLTLILLLLRSEHRRNWQLQGALVVVLGGLVLSHEASIVCFPYFIAAVVVAKKTFSSAVRLFAMPAVVSAIALAAVMLHPGTRQTAQSICKSVGGTLNDRVEATDVPGICNGSILWLQAPIAEYRELTRPHIHQPGIIPRFSFLALLAFFPGLAALLAFYRRDRLCFEVTVVALCTAVAISGSLYLFPNGMDWGRWINMQAVCLMLLVLFLAGTAKARTHTGSELSAPPHRWQRAFACTALAVYTTCWTLPMVSEWHISGGYLAFAANAGAKLIQHAGPVESP